MNLDDRRKLHICTADKLAVREYVFKNTNDPNLLNHLYGVYDNPDDIYLGELFSECIYNLSIVDLAMNIHQFDFYFGRKV